MLSGISWRRKAVCGLFIVGASYLVAAFANASPVTQPALAGASLRTPAVIVVPSAEAQRPADGGPMRAGSAEYTPAPLHSI